MSGLIFTVLTYYIINSHEEVVMNLKGLLFVDVNPKYVRVGDIASSLSSLCNSN